MSFAGIQATVNLYTMEESSLTYQLSEMMMNLVRASSKTTEVGENYADIKAEINKNAKDNTSYDPTSDLAQAKDNYELELAKMNEWETELEAKKQVIETDLKSTTSYKESFVSMLKQNVQKDFKYAQNGS